LSVRLSDDRDAVMGPLRERKRRAEVDVNERRDDLADAQRAENDRQADARRAEVKTLAKQVERRLADRDAIGHELIASIAKVTADFNRFWVAERALYRTWPQALGRFPDELFRDADKLCHAIREEMWRQGGTSVLHTPTDKVAPAFAGLRPGDLHLSVIGAHPSGFTSLADRLAASTAYILATIERRPVDFAQLDREKDPEHAARVAAHAALARTPFDPAAAAARMKASMPGTVEPADAPEIGGGGHRPENATIQGNENPFEVTTDD
jgi:hypothetical protein